MAENFVGLQQYVKSEFIDKTYEQAAVVMLKRAIDYEAGAILNKSWKCIKDMVADTPNMNIIQQIIDEAYFDYLQDAKAGNVDQEEQNLVEKQVKFYNAMVEHAYKEAKEAYIKELAQKHYDAGNINEMVYEAFTNYKVEITD